jgi:large subunit ribosomal protein L14
MIFPKTILKTADNSGAKYVKCLRILETKSTRGKKRFGIIGDIILVSVRICQSQKKVKKGNVFKAIIVRTLRKIKRESGWLFFRDNAVVLLNKKMLPVGTRVFGPIARDIKYRKMTKILSGASLIM